MVFMDVPLLFELGYESWFDQLWLVNVSGNKQLERLRARNQLNQQHRRLRTPKSHIAQDSLGIVDKQILPFQLITDEAIAFLRGLEDVCYLLGQVCVKPLIVRLAIFSQR